MRPLLLNILLGFAWVSVTGDLSLTNFLFGVVLGYVLILAFRNTLFPSTTYHYKVFQVLYFILFFIWELILSNLRVAREVLTPNLYARPGIIGVPLDLDNDLQITILANLITLTPGTLSLDVSSDKKTLYVHTMYVDDPDEFRQSIKQGFEKRVKELFE
jgi:multicomponent Na+:H+ antiporter subunit E